MAKNIIICSDGTGNTAIKGRGTNVFKLFEAVDLNGHRSDPRLTPQIALYDDGVGTENFKPLKILAGATGFGLSRNVRQLYKELVRVYDPGDRIFLFGFSRGAFTVRSLVGFIATCGILDRTDLKSASRLQSAVRKAYRHYRRCYRTALGKLFHGLRSRLFKLKTDEAHIEKFKDKRSVKPDPSITFIGVWDTVDAVGLPFHIGDIINSVFYRFKFPDQKLSKSVERACHALALDDERHSFHPLLWDETDETSPRVEQVWFAGAHSNVGGGYPKQGMSLVALDWMLNKASESGLRIIASDRTLYADHANIDDKLYDPRAGLGMFYRWKPRDMMKICETNGVEPKLHMSVLERIAHGTEDYSPGNLDLSANVVSTMTGRMEEDAALQRRARAVEEVLTLATSSSSKQTEDNGRHSESDLQKLESPTRSLLTRVRGRIIIGFASYYVYVLSSAAAILALAAGRDGFNSFSKPITLVENSSTVVTNIVGLRIGALIENVRATGPWALGLVAAGLLLSYVLGLAADRRMSSVFSEFWHRQQTQLREALKSARSIGLGRGA